MWQGKSPNISCIYPKIKLWNTMMDAIWTGHGRPWNVQSCHSNIRWTEMFAETKGLTGKFIGILRSCKPVCPQSKRWSSSFTHPWNIQMQYVYIPPTTKGKTILKTFYEWYLPRSMGHFLGTWAQWIINWDGPPATIAFHWHAGRAERGICIPKSLLDFFPSQNGEKNHSQSRFSSPSAWSQQDPA